MKKIVPLKENKEKIKWSYKEKREFELLENEIPLLEEKKKIWEEKLSQSSDAGELAKYSSELGKIIEELDQKSMRWLELVELSGQ